MKAFLSECGFENIEPYGLTVKPTMDSIGYTLASNFDFNDVCTDDDPYHMPVHAALQKRRRELRAVGALQAVGNIILCVLQIIEITIGTDVCEGRLQGLLRVLSLRKLLPEPPLRIGAFFQKMHRAFFGAQGQHLLPYAPEYLLRQIIPLREVLYP